MYEFKVNFDSILMHVDWKQYQNKIQEIHDMMACKKGKGSEYSGWLEWCDTYEKKEVDHIKKCAKRIRDTSDICLICGVGGSYLGAKAGIDMVRGNYDDDNIEIIFIGNTFSSTQICRVLKHCEGKDICCNVISKSGQTTETALAFRIIRQYMEKRYGIEESIKRIYVTTDKEKGLLRPMCEEMGYESFIIPDAIGGRFSVITPVGLLPMAIAGINIEAFINGACDSAKRFKNANILENEAYQYALLRYLFKEKGYISEMFVTYEPHMTFVMEWLKQLFGESEGKEGKGLLPHGVTNSTDLHSMGQFIQQGTKCLFETIIHVKEPMEDLIFPNDAKNKDQMNYLSGKSVHWINEQAKQGTKIAHVEDGKVPNIEITIQDCSAYGFGYIVYFFFRVLTMSAYLIDVNPFDQPGVEIYKQNMYRLLKKPGY